MACILHRGVTYRACAADRCAVTVCLLCFCVLCPYAVPYITSPLSTNRLIGGTVIIISEVTHISQDGDREYCLLSEELNPVRKNSKQVLVFSSVWGPADKR
jgi:hypothetical protein